MLLAALAAAPAAMWWAASRPAQPVQPFFVDAPGARARDTVTVHVCGEVKQPGLYTLPAGSRIHEAIAAAGGATPKANLNALNLASEVLDGQRLFVPAAAAATREPLGAAPTQTAPAPALAPVERVSLNRATIADLDRLPGIGPAYARRIIEYRERLKAETGQGFTRVEQLLEVPGIGPKRFADIKDQVTL